MLITHRLSCSDFTFLRNVPSLILGHIGRHHPPPATERAPCSPLVGDHHLDSLAGGAGRVEKDPMHLHRRRRHELPHWGWQEFPCLDCAISGNYFSSGTCKFPGNFPEISEISRRQRRRRNNSSTNPSDEPARNRKSQYSSRRSVALSLE